MRSTMTKHGLEVFETTLQKSYTWLNELMFQLRWEDRQKAYLVLRGTLHALRDRLPMELAVKFGAQLPMLIRGLYYEGWKPSITPIKVKNLEEFLDFVYSHFRQVISLNDTDLTYAVRAVFQIVADHVSPGEVDHIRQALPPSLSELWPR